MTELVAAAAVEVNDLSRAPAGEDIEYDAQHRIIGWGLTLNPTPHSFIVDGQHLYTVWWLLGCRDMRWSKAFLCGVVQPGQDPPTPGTTLQRNM